MGKVRSIYVPSVGDENSSIMFVGEAPGADEEREKEPFVGKAGQFFTRYLQRKQVNLSREEVFLTNLSKYRPHKNRFPHLIGSPQLEKGLKELSEEIEKVDPNIIVALGAWPMYYLTGCISTAKNAKPGSGVMQWRGSVVPGIGDHIPAAEGRKVLITLHPAFIMRATGFQWHPIFATDLKRVPKHGATPDFLYPEYESFIDPPNLVEVAHEFSKSEWLTIDIETFGSTLACVGFADSTKRGLCITYECEHGWEIARELMENQQKKIYQYGTYDVNYVAWHYGWEPQNFAHDTLIAAANLLPEFPKRLDFLCSIYTEFPFYKEERKEWKLIGDQRILWEYNIKDVIATHDIAFQQMRELEILYGKAT